MFLRRVFEDEKPMFCNDQHSVRTSERWWGGSVGEREEEEEERKSDNK